MRTAAAVAAADEFSPSWNLIQSGSDVQLVSFSLVVLRRPPARLVVICGMPTCVPLFLFILEPLHRDRRVKCIFNCMASCFFYILVGSHNLLNAQTPCAPSRKTASARVLILFFRETKGNSFDISSCSCDKKKE